MSSCFRRTFLPIALLVASMNVGVAAAQTPVGDPRGD